MSYIFRLKKVLFILFIFVFNFISFSVFSADELEKINVKPIGTIIPEEDLKDQNEKVGESENNLRDQLLGNLIKGRLEMMHLAQKPLDDEFSENAFKLFIERLDPSKQFLLQSDIDQLTKYKKLMVSSLTSGNFAINTEGSRIFNERVNEVQKIVREILKKPFDYTKKEELETDSKKREFCKTKDELKDRWYKVLKYGSLIKYISSIDGQEAMKKEKEKEKEQEKEKKSKKVAKKKEKKDTFKIKSLKELEKEARDDTLKNYERIFTRMLQEDHDDQLERFFNSIAMVFDPHTNYFPPQKKEDFDIEMKGSLEGIGALLRPDGPYIKVVKIIPGSASWKDKRLKPEDTILKVGQENESPVDIVNMRITDAVKLIRGKKGTKVNLTVKKPSGEILVVSLVRDVVQIEDAYAKAAILQKDKDAPKVGYIYLPRFYRDFEAQSKGEKPRNCTEDVEKFLKMFNKEKVSNVILDLRNNSGGALEDARYMTGLFIPSGPVVQVRQGKKTKDVLYDGNQEMVFDKNIVVLINKFSASASEIVAAALQDYKRAVIVGGEHSHGKGTVQVYLNLDQGLNRIAGDFLPLGALKVTIQKFYRITGGSTQYKGVTPDIVLPDQFEYLESGEKYLDYSLPWDEIEPVKFKVWDQTKLDVEKLKVLSKARVDKSEDFKNLKATIDILKKRKDQTIVSLNYQMLKDEQEKINKETEKLKFDTLDEKMVIYKEDKGKISLVPAPKKEEVEKKEKEQKEKENKDETLIPEDNPDWVLDLRKDPYIFESLNIVNDIISQN